MKSNINLNFAARLAVVLLVAASLKFYYSAASVDALRWILAPTASLVQILSGITFSFESNAGYMSGDHTFLIAASCSGVNFLIAAFLMLAVGAIWRTRQSNGRWQLIPAALLIAYLATIIANTVRISLALELRTADPASLGLTAEQFHRFEGIIVYFGFLLILFFAAEKYFWPSGAARDSGKRGLLRLIFPLTAYYAITLAIPIANGAHRVQADFWEHSAYVLLTPLVLALPVAAGLCSRVGTSSRD